MKINFDQEMNKIIEGLKGEKPRLLLHACCAPCATVCIERLKEFFDLTVYFYNPNMDGLEEYVMRANELKRLCKALNVSCEIAEYDSAPFIEIARGKENLPERGDRCTLCYNLRLSEACKMAKGGGYDYFATTLTLSPLKDSERLNDIGLKVSESQGVKYLPTDFKKRGGYLRSIQMSNEYNLYRQNYCGCIFSKNNK